MRSVANYSSRRSDHHHHHHHYHNRHHWNWQWTFRARNRNLYEGPSYVRPIPFDSHSISSINPLSVACSPPSPAWPPRLRPSQRIISSVLAMDYLMASIVGIDMDDACGCGGLCRNSCLSFWTPKPINWRTGTCHFCVTKKTHFQPNREKYFTQLLTRSVAFCPAASLKRCFSVMVDWYSLAEIDRVSSWIKWIYRFTVRFFYVNWIFAVGDIIFMFKQAPTHFSGKLLMNLIKFSLENQTVSGATGFLVKEDAFNHLSIMKM